MKENKNAVELLNGLIQINNDRMEGYRHASKETDESDLKALFSVLSATSRKCIEELSDQVKAFGGQPTKETTTSGKLFRIWMDVKSAITQKDRRAILDSCEYGEDWAVKTYEAVLKDHFTDLNFEQNQLVREQYEWVKKDHDKVKYLRDAVAA